MRTRGLLLMALLPLALCAQAAVLDGPTMVSYLTTGTTPSGLALVKEHGTATGWQPTRKLDATPLIWYSDALTGDIAGGFWSLRLWTSSPANPTTLKVEVLKTDTKGGNEVVLGSSNLDLDTGGGNSASALSIKVAKAPFKGELLALRISKVTGDPVTIAFNTNDFDSSLTGGGGGGGGDSTVEPGAYPPSTPLPDGAMTFTFVNKTNGKYTDAQIFWTLDGTTFKSIAEAPTTVVPQKGGGRCYISLGVPMKNLAGEGSYFDFMEYTLNPSGFHGNTTQVDAFGIPMTIEVVDANGLAKKVGITQSRDSIFADFKKEVPKEFLSCVKEPYRIVSPCQADFGVGQANGHYFDAYIDEVWAMYATEKKTPGGWTGVVKDGALTFTSPTGIVMTCPSKPTTQEALLGSGVLGGLPQFCAAINRHVLADPADWNNPAKYYQAAPANYYAKFWHDHSINPHAYGFCYDDVNAQDSLIEVRHPVNLNICIYWN